MDPLNDKKITGVIPLEKNQPTNEEDFPLDTETGLNTPNTNLISGLGGAFVISDDLPDPE